MVRSNSDITNPAGMNIPELLDELNDAVTNGTAERRAAILHSITVLYLRIVALFR